MIVLVEDDDTMRMVTQLALKTIGGWDVISFASGEEALAMAQTLKPDLLVLDVAMPGMTGPQTLQRMRALPELAKTPVVFLTASTRAAEVTSYRAHGALDVIAKPFDPRQMCQRIAAVLSTPRSGESVASPTDTALIVEDDPGIRYLLRFILEQEGWHVQEATTGAEGMAALSGRPAAIVLLDIMLPGVDGLEILEALRASQTWALVPVMMLTARGDETAMKRALAAGANDYLAKPFDPAELAARLKRLIPFSDRS